MMMNLIMKWIMKWMMKWMMMKRKNKKLKVVVQTCSDIKINYPSIIKQILCQ